MDELFVDTGKKIIRTSNEILFDQFGTTLLPYNLSSGEKQLLVIIVTTHSPALIMDGWMDSVFDVEDITVK